MYISTRTTHYLCYKKTLRHKDRELCTSDWCYANTKATVFFRFKPFVMINKLIKIYYELIVKIRLNTIITLIKTFSRRGKRKPNRWKTVSGWKVKRPSLKLGNAHFASALNLCSNTYRICDMLMTLLLGNYLMVNVGSHCRNTRTKHEVKFKFDYK